METETDSESEATISEKLLDYLCWQMLFEREHWYPPEETAAECVEAMESDDTDLDTDESYEMGYHVGMYLAYDDVIEALYAMGIDVRARANRYIAANREAGVELRSDDESMYFESTDHGARARLRDRDLLQEYISEVVSLEIPYEIETE